MTKGIQVTVEYMGDGSPCFILDIYGNKHVLTLDDVDILSDLLQLKIEETIRHYQELLSKPR